MGTGSEDRHWYWLLSDSQKKLVYILKMSDTDDLEKLDIPESAPIIVTRPYYYDLITFKVGDYTL